ncbi:hypothetical protein [Cupriavidus necator]|uniref:hypothetical protein n=1 Tax=Cupriavidus necator TaxID=106590 RepID=UPI00339D7DDD
MSETARIDSFGTALRDAFVRFQQEETIIRADVAASVEAGTVPNGLDIESMLERPTRRFLIDPMLRALGWDPDDPRQLTEEARSWAENGDRLYFDYLGLNQRRAPTLLVEAKGADANAPRPPRAPDVSGEEMAVLISEALGILKSGSRPTAVLAQWAEWLSDLQTYVRSLGLLQRTTLRRVAITAGRWLIIFADPLACFVDDGAPGPGGIHCYTSLAEIVDRHSQIYRLLARRRLTDTLPLTLTLQEILEVLDPSAVEAVYRGVVVATRMSGGVRGQYPTRSVYPAIVLITDDRAFAAVDYYGVPAEEPRDADGIEAFLTRLIDQGNSYERRVLGALGRTELTALPVEQYPITIREPEIAQAFAAAIDSTEALAAAATPLRPQLARRTGERNAENEYLIITGQDWFYKAVSPFGPTCDFHSFPPARRLGVAGAEGQFDRVANAFTISGDPQHCEHADLHGMRSSRCQLDSIESHLCCRVCIFHRICWAPQELARLPCAT